MIELHAIRRCVTHRVPLVDAPERVTRSGNVQTSHPFLCAGDGSPHLVAVWQVFDASTGVVLATCTRDRIRFEAGAGEVFREGIRRLVIAAALAAE